MSWIAVAIGGATAIAGSVEANATRQREKGLIGTAYSTASARMNLAQRDTRQQVAEQSGARGLDNGGGVVTGGPATPGETVNVGGAHTLGGQQTLDEEREQALEQTSLKNESVADLSNVNAAADQGIIGSAAAGISTAFGVKSAMTAGQQPQTPPSTTPGGTNTPNQDLASTSFGGINPVNPLGSGAWANPSAGSSGAWANPSAGSSGAGAKDPNSTSNFNVNG